MTPPPGRPLETLTERLSDRDWAVLDDLARVRLLSGRQIQRLRMHEGSGRTQARRTRALLQRLHDLGLVHRLGRRIGGVRAGSAGFVYGLSTNGQRLTTNRGPAGGRRLRRPWEPSRHFLDHTLAISELYVELREHERRSDLELVDFATEPSCWRSWTNPHGERSVLKPDAHLVLGVGSVERHRFIEVDRDTESRPVLRRKAQVYIVHWSSGEEQRRRGVYPSVLWLVPDEARKTQLVEVLAGLPAEHWQLFEIHLQAEALNGLSAIETSQMKGGDDA